MKYDCWATIRLVPRKRALDGESKGTSLPFSPVPGCCGKRSISAPSGPTAAIWFAASSVM